jgi:transposase
VSGEFDVSVSYALDRASRRERNRRIVEEYGAGVPLEQIAEKYGVVPGYISVLASRQGIRRYRTYKGSRDEVIQKYVAGESVRALAQEYTLDRKTIYKWINAAGVREDRPHVRLDHTPAPPLPDGVAMRCPYCGSDRLEVVDKRDHNGTARRRRACNACRYRFYTMEVICGPTCEAIDAAPREGDIRHALYSLRPASGHAAEEHGSAVHDGGDARSGEDNRTLDRE